jgi:hypothetical protein
VSRSSQAVRRSGDPWADIPPDLFRIKLFSAFIRKMLIKFHDFNVFCSHSIAMMNIEQVAFFHFFPPHFLKTPGVVARGFLLAWLLILDLNNG